MPQGAGLFSSLALEVAKYNKSISVIYASDNNLFKTNSDLFKNAAPASLKIDLIPIQSNSDVRTETSQVAKSKSEAFAIFVPLEAGIKILNEIKKYPTRPKLICDANMALTIEQYTKAVGEEIFDGCIATIMSETKTSEFINLYKKTYQSDPQFGSDLGYDAIQIINKLIKNDRGSWVSILNNKFTQAGFSGLITFDETGTRAAYTETRVFRGGKFVKYEDK
jgi:ABC-type branched-subunit amino acid transport system substrate-binding protein